MQLGDRCVVFSQWTGLLSIVEKLLQSECVCVQVLCGSLTSVQRNNRVKWLGEDGGGGRVLLVSLMAGGVGLNLTAANSCYLMDFWWNPAVEEQAVQRIHRIGQTKPVKIVRLLAKDSVEERILELQSVKSQRARDVLSYDLESLHSPVTVSLGVKELTRLFESFSRPDGSRNTRTHTDTIAS
eukprot:GHVR01018666.1.p1 GENE.GHVR01018666.1~~GHVR01018666.1.p1  ORF type:complete len:183 (-),score=47.03 GHVR01018666.1:91-639(-)